MTLDDSSRTWQGWAAPSKNDRRELRVRRGTKAVLGTGFAGSIVLGGYVGPATAAATTVQRITESTLHDGAPPGDPDDTGYYRDDTRTGGGVNLTNDFVEPAALGGDDGAVALTTNNTTTAKAQLFTSQFRGTLLATITGLSYYTFQGADHQGFEDGAVAYQITVDRNGGELEVGDFLTLTYEPYLNPSVQAVEPEVWQFWDATNGNWYSSRDINCGSLVITASSGAPPFTNPTQVGTNCVGATVLNVGINIGSGNANYVTAADGLHFQTATEGYTGDFGPK
jgi:hypothetical protein